MSTPYQRGKAVLTILQAALLTGQLTAIKDDAALPREYWIEHDIDLEDKSISIAEQELILFMETQIPEFVKREPH